MTQSQGQWRLPYVDLSVFGGDTAATLAIIAPDDTSAAVDVTGSEANAHWEGDDPYQFTTAGQWIERWTVTGTGANTIDNTVEVGPLANPDNGLRIYANSADYANIMHTAPPVGIRRALLVASGMVDEMLFTAVYDTDDDGMPTDTEDIAALMKATCEQVEFAGTGGDKNLVGANKPSNFSLGKLSVTRAQPKTSGDLGGRGPRGEWSPRAWATLQAAGLTGHEAWSR